MMRARMALSHSPVCQDAELSLAYGAYDPQRYMEYQRQVRVNKVSLFLSSLFMSINCIWKQYAVCTSTCKYTAMCRACTTFEQAKGGAGVLSSCWMLGSRCT